MIFLNVLNKKTTGKNNPVFLLSILQNTQPKAKELKTGQKRHVKAVLFFYYSNLSHERKTKQSERKTNGKSTTKQGKATTQSTRKATEQPNADLMTAIFGLLGCVKVCLCESTAVMRV